ncbi:MAG: hypothetical protein EBZ77_13885, partial [Chitinophagia bacterium]|nr:hypothetical protein [Chitinophagia bacterium]
TDTFAFPTGVSLSSLTALTTEQKTITCTLNGTGAVTRVLVYTATSDTAPKTLVGSSATAQVACTFRAAGTYRVFVRTCSTIGTVQPDFLLATTSFVVSDFVFPDAVAAAETYYSVVGAPLTSTLVLSGPNLGSLRMAAIRVFLGTAAATVNGYTPTGPSAGYLVCTVTPASSGLVAPRVVLSTPDAPTGAQTATLVSAASVFVDAAGSTYTMPRSATVAPATVVDAAQTTLTLTTVGASAASASVSLVYYDRTGSPVVLGTGTLAANTASVSCVLPLGTWSLAFSVTSPLGVQGPLVAAGTVTARPYKYPTSAGLTNATAFTSEQKQVQIALAGGDAVAATASVYAASSSAPDTLQLMSATATVSSDGTCTATCALPTAGTYTVYVRAIAPNGVQDQSAAIKATGTIVVSDYVFPSSFTFTVPTAGIAELQATPITIRTTGESADASAQIDVYYGTSTGVTDASALTKCGSGTLSAGTAVVSVLVPSGSKYLYIRTVSPGNVIGPLTGNATVVNARVYVFPSGITTTTTSAFTGERKTVQIALLGGDAGPVTVAVFASAS